MINPIDDLNIDQHESLQKTFPINCSSSNICLNFSYMYHILLWFKKKPQTYL